MKRAVIFVLPLLLTACSGAKQYLGNASQQMDDNCATRATFNELFACTKDRLVNDPLAPMSPAENVEINTYGEQLGSQLRQRYITDAQAREAFEQKVAQVKARHQPAPATVQ